MPDIIACPDPTCQVSACIRDRWTWESRHGPVEHVKAGREHGEYQAAPATANDPFWRNRFVSVGSAGPILHRYFPSRLWSADTCGPCRVISQ